jgi:hypothetical protein
MRDDCGSAVLSESDHDEIFTFEAENFMGTNRLKASYQKSVLAGAAARGTAAQLSLADNVPWTFVDQEGRFLDDHLPLGQQIKPGETVTVVPKAHLG